ncbi:flavin monooxygenase-like protein [Globomyces pollinis-pini]|nr:flavin monooxygenase-like protein [Globomyces pollinis-pini]
MTINETKRVAIIGAGPSGLTAIKHCLEEGLLPVCFEAGSNIGGLWRYCTKGERESHSSVYKSTVVNTSKQMMAFSDSPIPSEWPNFLPHELVADYLELYCDKFKLGKHIKFNRQVQSIKPEVENGIETGRWEVIYRKPINTDSYPSSPILSATCSPIPPKKSLSSQPSFELNFPKHRSSEDSFNSDKERSKKKSSLKKDVFDFIMVCTGHHWKPRLPEFPGMNDFKGTVIHSHKYKVPYPFKDDKVLIVGVGNSGMEISSELAAHASSVYLSSRSGTWIAPRVTLFGLPTDQLSTRAANSLPRPLLNFALETLMQLHNGNLEKYNLKPGHSFLESPPVVGTQVLNHIESGKIIVKPNVAKINANSVEFTDGTVQEVDTIIYCTGYVIENPFIDSEIIGKEEPDSNRVKLYKHIFPTSTKNMAFIGLVQPTTGSILPVAELQARWATRVFTDKCKLPSLKDMRDQTSIDYREHLTKFVPRERTTIAVETVVYMDMIADQIGVKPDLWRLWKSNWTLAAQVTFGPTVSSHYRLYGPNKWDGAQQVISEACVGLDWKKIAEEKRKTN